MKNKLVLIKLIIEENGENCFVLSKQIQICEKKKHSLKAQLGKDSEKAAHKKLPKNVNRSYLTWQKHTDGRRDMNERQLKTTE